MSRCLNRFSINLRYAVSEMPNELRIGVWLPVPLGVDLWIRQTKIGAQVDHSGRESRKCIETFDCAPMWQTQEKEITGLKLLQGAELEGAGTAQIGVRFMEGLSGKALGGDLLDLARIMKKQQPQQFATGIAGPPNDRHTDHGRGASVKSTIRAGMLTPVVEILFRNSMV